MNRYFMIRRLTGPLVLLLLGVVALLHQMHMAHWGIFVPLLLILLGLMKLAERAALETDNAWQPPDPAGGHPLPNTALAVNAAPGSTSAPQDSIPGSPGGQL